MKRARYPIGTRVWKSGTASYTMLVVDVDPPMGLCMCAWRTPNGVCEEWYSEAALTDRMPPVILVGLVKPQPRSPTV